MSLNLVVQLDKQVAFQSVGGEPGPLVVELATLEWVSWFSHHRLLGRLATFRWQKLK